MEKRNINHLELKKDRLYIDGVEVKRVKNYEIKKSSTDKSVELTLKLDIKLID